MKTLIASLVLLVAMTASAQAQDTDLESIDENSDGKVTVAEFKEYAESRFPPDFDRLDEFAKKVDADGNGEISEDEFADRMDVLQNMPLEAESGDAESGDAEEEKKEKSSDKKKKTDKTVVEAYEKLSKQVEKADWKEAAKLMTQTAQDEFASTEFLKSKSFLAADMPMQLPGMDEVLDNLEDVFDKHDLDDLDADVDSMFRIEMMDGDSDDDEKEDEDEKDEDEKKESKKLSPAEKQKEMQKKILKFMDKDNKRWEIVGDLWKAQEGSPFQVSHLYGTAKEHEVEKDNAFIRVEMKLPQQDGMPNNISFQAPPIWVKMKKVKDNWKFDGVDRERTQKAMQKFRRNMPGRRPAPRKAEDDF